MNDIDINTVLNTLVGKYVIANGRYSEALEGERAYPNAYDIALERAELSGVIQGLTIALVALGEDISKIDSLFRIDGV